MSDTTDMSAPQASDDVAPVDGVTSEVSASASEETELPNDDGVVEDVQDEVLVPEDSRTRDELILALREAEVKRDEYLTDLQRMQAEFDNFRKRSMREGVQQRDMGAAEMTTKLLDVLDDFDLALLSVDKSGDFDALHKGLELIYAKMFGTLSTAGLTRIEAEGIDFNPERHEAVQQVPAEDGPLDVPRVDEVLRQGYEFKGRVLRAAMVKVAS